MLKIKFKRRLVQYKYSQLMCLPLVWVNARELHKGDFVECEILEDGNLLIRPHAEVKQNEAAQS